MLISQSLPPHYYGDILFSIQQLAIVLGVFKFAKMEILVDTRQCEEFACSRGISNKCVKLSMAI